MSVLREEDLESENMMNAWMQEFVREVDAIDYFFVDKMKEYVK